MKISALLLLVAAITAFDGFQPPSNLNSKDSSVPRLFVPGKLAQAAPLVPNSFKATDQIVYQDSELIIRAAPGDRKFSQTESQSLVRGVGRQDSVVNLSLAKNETEGFHLVVTPISKQTQINSINISTLTKTQSSKTIAPQNIAISKIGYVWGESRNKPGQKEGPFADVLFPNSATASVQPYRNHNYYLAVSTPENQDSGFYQGEISLNTPDRTINIPLRIQVWNYAIPNLKSVNTQLFEVDEDNIYYTYNLEPWHPKAQQMLSTLYESLAKNRISPAKTPPIEAIQWEQFPDQTPGFQGQGLTFDRQQRLRLAGPKFDQLKQGFTLGFYLKQRRPDFDFKLSHFWQKNGYEISINATDVAVKVGAGRNKSRDQVHTSDVNYTQNLDWSHIALTYDNQTLKIYIDGQLKTSSNVPFVMQPSMRVADLRGHDVTVDQIQWFDRALNDRAVRDWSQASTANVIGVQPLRTYDFEDKLYRFQDQKTAHNEISYARQWEKWVHKNGLWINDLKESVQGQKSAPSPNIVSWLKLKSLSRAYVNLPNDESFDGPKSLKNKKYARAVQGIDSEIDILQTFGAMSGKNTTAAQKLNALRSHVGLIDIWSVRPLIFERFRKDFFEARIEQGEQISPYIHRTESVENELGVLNSRLFFWKLYSQNMTACTYWIMNLWNYPVTRNGARPKKETIPVENGFFTTRRNPSSSASGIVLWPGENGILSSLRIEGWRDGMEDYEQFKLLDSLTKAKKRSDPNHSLVKRSEALTREIQSLTSLSDQRWTFKTASLHQQYRLIREKTGDLINDFALD